MRTVTLQMNYRANPDVNWSVKTEVLVDDDEHAWQAGNEAARFISRFQEGMVEGFYEAPDVED